MITLQRAFCIKSIFCPVQSILAKKFYQIIDLVLIGCRNKKFLHRYENEQEMHEACDIVVEMIDSSYWKVFSKNGELIESIKNKFEKIELLDSE